MSTQRHILMIFVDGLGIGEQNSDINPCTFSPHFFSHFQHETYPKPLSPMGQVSGLDATLFLDGLPQSATGQTALLTGVNAAQHLGRHLNGFPNQQLRDLLREFSIFKWFVDNGYKARFLNTFRPPFFDYNPYDIIKRLSVTTVSNLVAGLPFFSLNDLREQRSIYQDIIGNALVELGFQVPLYTPEQAGEIVARESSHNHFSLFEYFQTDRAGHSQNMPRCREVLEILERFMGSVLAHVDLNRTLVILTSDHGNFEDLSSRSHTRNKAMTVVFGRDAESIIAGWHSIIDIYPAIISLFK